jgi:pentatricopeptide repeat protein
MNDINSLLQSYSADSSGLGGAISDMCQKNYDAASALFFEGRAKGLMNQENATTDMFLNLCSACIRVGSPHFIFKYFAEMDELNLVRDLKFFHSIIKLLVSKGHYKVALSVNDNCLSLIPPTALGEENLTEIAKSIYSCLLYACLESREFWRALKFFRQMEKTGQPATERDVSNVVSAVIAREDWKSLSFLLVKDYGAINTRRVVESAVQALHRHNQTAFIGFILRSAKATKTVDNTLVTLKYCKNRQSYLDCILDRSEVGASTIEIVSECVGAWTIEDPVASVRRVLDSDLVKSKPQFATSLVNQLVKRSKNARR